MVGVRVRRTGKGTPTLVIGFMAQNRTRAMRKMWDWWQESTGLKRWHVTSLWLVIVVLAAWCGFQQGTINNNSRIGDTAAEGLQRIETKLDGISANITSVTAEGGSGGQVYVLAPDDDAARQALIQIIREGTHNAGRLPAASSDD